ncbi:hypothetical protein EUX98_g3790 [Antrodiella citrinella]|uniref:Signal recognition particle subunit SRP68 n=1 Tax=Antrodiella citrinella TaxID=2447956 RepID=A0A4S4MXQ0_9APHY|nr:hypothetical protein EUX98_g3790 [Antrodiella citrinella]
MLLYVRTHRCRYLARCYTPLKKYAEALTLVQHGTLHIREARQALSLLPPSATDAQQTDDPINNAQHPSFYSLTTSDVALLDDELSADGLQCKKDWFTFNGGHISSASSSSADAGSQTHKKPLFFDIALNYVQLDMERLQERAGKAPAPLPLTNTAKRAPAGSDKDVAQPELAAERKAAGKTTKLEAADSRVPTPEPSSQAQRGGLGTLLGGWWGRK